MAVDDLYGRARQALERGRYDYAIELLREVLRRDPSYPEARILLRASERRRLEEKGRSILSTLGLVPRAVITALRAALSKPPGKLEAFEDYLEANPNSFWALMAAARAARAAGLGQEAVNLYKDALNLRPNNTKTLRALGDTLRETGDHEEALKYLTRLAELMPADRDLQREVRDLAASDHMAAHEMAPGKSFREMIRDKEQAAELEQSGRMAVTMDDLHRRVAEAEKELAESPDNVNRILTLAKLYVDTDQWEKAHKLLRQKHRELPDNYEIRERLGDVQLRMYELAAARLEERLQKNPNDSAAKSKKQELDRRRVELALREYSWRISQHPTDRHLRLLIGRAYFEAGQYNEAIAAFQNAAQDARFAEESISMLGRCFLEKAQYDLALEQFERAIQAHPETDEQRKELLYYQAQTYEKMGKQQEALEIYKKLYSQDITFKDVSAKVEALSG